jgi:hypothetical protein
MNFPCQITGLILRAGADMLPLQKVSDIQTIVMKTNFVVVVNPRLPAGR